MNRTHAEAFFQDPRIAEAKKLLLETLSDHQKQLISHRPANPNLKTDYDELLATYAEFRGGKLWYRYLGSGMGKGALVELLDGSIKYDFITGIGVHYFGHSHPTIISAAVDAALCDTIMEGNLQQNFDAYRLTETLINASKMDHCFLTTSGAMAVENGLKIIFQKKHPANRILAFERCFMGRSLVASQITDRPNYREGLPNNIFVDYIPFYDPDHPEMSTARAVTALKQQLARYPKQYAVMCFELIQGDGGFYVASKSFFEAIMKVLKEHDVAIFIDEVQTFGRTPELFAFHYFGLQEYADVVTIGKLSQACATLFRKNFAPQLGLLSQTFISSVSAIQTGQVIIDELLSGGYYGADGKVHKIFNYFSNKLKSLSERYPEKIRGPFGLGGMIAFTPFDGSYDKAVKLAHDLFDAGLICFITGTHPTRIRFLVPMGVITFDDIDGACTILENVLTS